MKSTSKNTNLACRALGEQDGQAAVWLIFLFTLFLGMAGLALDISHAVLFQRALQASADAAALAGTKALMNGTGSTSQSDAETAAHLYGSESGDNNAYPGLAQVAGHAVSLTPSVSCVTSIGSLVNCTTDYPYNSVQVVETATIPTYFIQMLSVFGVASAKTMTLTATSTGALAGTRLVPANIAVIVDTTASMNTTDTNCGHTRIDCALIGIQSMLQTLVPCDKAITPNCTLTDASVDRVALFTFPNVTVGSATNETTCDNSTSPTIPVYSLPSIGATTYAPSGSSTATYEITPFEIDYLADAGVNTSAIAIAVGSGTKSSGTACTTGLQSPGGDGTYYAGVIYAAQASLTAAASNYPSTSPLPPSMNLMIILTDGEANASSSKMASGLNTTAIPSNGGATSSATNYPSAVDQCQQAVAAANYAKQNGTSVYAVAYGSESSGCTTDSSGPQANITPCQVMSEMAGPATNGSPTPPPQTVYFYSDYNQSGSSSTCVSTGSSATSLSGIMEDIANSLGIQARLIPNGS